MDIDKLSYSCCKNIDTLNRQYKVLCTDIENDDDLNTFLNIILDRMERGTIDLNEYERRFILGVCSAIGKTR